ncbi:hypothetical protein BSL78_08628 [Apostichopus japonicus]|uniref:Mon2 C-terminal domain-containing protein n=1 Tax=Stichopus japonicus TaxID=307972 RepID=A0A2G8L2L4_STIJA|nr:hypothetical protein BSL78_08628 [Apostichopus japonicus]
MHFSRQAISDGTESMQSMYPAIFDQLLTFVTYSCQAPSFGHIETKAISKVSSKQTDWVAMNYVPFAEKSLEFTADLYKSTARHPVVMERTCPPKHSQSSPATVGTEVCLSLSFYLETIGAMFARHSCESVYP